MTYRVFIPCAGIGSRLGDLTHYINKSLVSIANRPALSHIIERFPNDVEFVIALGFKGQLVREFLTLAYPERVFYFVNISPFEGPQSGLGLTLQACKNYLQQPFVFNSCDTLVEDSIPAPDCDWMGCADVLDLKEYRTLTVESGLVHGLFEKGVGLGCGHKAYIGLAGIYNFEDFWRAMESGDLAAISNGESHGMHSLLKGGVRANLFKWNDIGNLAALASTRNRYREPFEPVILEKSNEAIWFVGESVIKFSDDRSFIANRVDRAQRLEAFVPQVTASTQNMYRYRKVEGKVLSRIVTIPLFDQLLDDCGKFWQAETLTHDKRHDFRQTCMKFYRDKTFERISLFYKKFDLQDGTQSINGKRMPKLEVLLGSLDWDWIADGRPGRFHGDLHFENIIWSEREKKFVFLDWRQDFGGNLSIGDIYYDLAKLQHGLIISHELIAKNFFNVRYDTESLNYDFYRTQILVECEQHFRSWLTGQGYDRKKVSVLTALIYLNIAVLHHHPYALMLYALGKSILNSELEK